MIDPALRELVRKRADWRCEYCRLRQDVAPAVGFHVEHVRPRQHGGGDEPTNLALACPRCNFFKGPNLSGIDPQSDRVVALFDPRREIWSEHFDLAGIEIDGLTPVGRATVHLLRMNEAERLEVRQALRDRGDLDR